MCLNLSEAAIAIRLARSRYGRTLFLCRGCGEDEGRQLTCRPRVWQCVACRRQQSVTSGTIMQASKVPLRVWMAVLEYFLGDVVPTATELAETQGIARSTAWHVVQRFMAHLQLVQDVNDLDVGALMLAVKCRGPRPSPAMKPHTEPRVLDLRHHFLHSVRPFQVAFTVRLHAQTARLGQVGVSRLNMTWKHPHVAERYHPGLERWLRSRLERTHGSVSLRWLGRWVGHLLMIWSDSGGRRNRRPPGLEPLVTGGPVPLHALRP